MAIGSRRSLYQIQICKLDEKGWNGVLLLALVYVFYGNLL